MPYVSPEEYQNMLLELEKQEQILKALETLYNVASSQLDQSATHDGLTNCSALAEARAALQKGRRS